MLTLGRWLGVDVYDTAGSWIFLREQTEAQRELFATILGHVGRMREVAAASGRRLYAVVIPNKLQVENGAELTGRIYDASAPDARILAWCGAEGIPCLDLLPALVAEAARSPEPLYYAADRHFTARGYAFAADRLLDFLRSEGALAAPAR